MVTNTKGQNSLANAGWTVQQDALPGTYLVFEKSRIRFRYYKGLLDDLFRILVTGDIREADGRFVDQYILSEFFL